MRVYHTLKPIYTKDSKILILGSIPSPKSREIGFYYGHPQNKFWKVLSDVLGQELPHTLEEKKRLLLQNNIALWDVLESCEINGASDSSIKQPVPNNLNSIIEKSLIKTIFVTSKKAEQLYNKFCLKKTNIPCIYLPSTSPANASIKYGELKKAYQIILNHLN